jgi:peptidase E
MAVYYLCSGFSLENAFNNEFGRRLKADISSTNSLVCFPAVRTDEDYIIAEEQVVLFQKVLAEIGIIFENAILITDKMTDNVICDYINKAGFIYMMGGYPWYELDLLTNHNLFEQLQNYNGVILGISAGAMIMSKYSVLVTDGINSDETVIKNGLGLVNFSVFPHCNFEGDEFVEAFYIGPDLVISESLLKASEIVGNFYMLQNKTPDGKEKISLIRSENGRNEIICISNGLVWKIHDRNFVIVDSIDG